MLLELVEFGGKFIGNVRCSSCRVVSVSVKELFFVVSCRVVLCWYCSCLKLTTTSRAVDYRQIYS